MAVLRSSSSPASTPDAFPAVVRRLRKALDLTQRELAQRVGCTEDLISKIEAGRRKPSKQLAGLLAVQLRVPVAEREAFVALARETHEPTPANTPANPSPSSLPAHNLPALHTRMFGRREDVARIAALLQQHDARLVTLTGAGGVGKTQLALAVARAVLPAFADDVWFVSLESLGSPALVMASIASALGLSPASDTPARQQIIDHLAGKHALLVLDNFEQVLPAATDVRDVLDACASVHVLTTSRERLRLRAERVVQVKPLGVPARNADKAQFAESPAVQLFVDRASALDAEFALTDDTAPMVADLCRQLDGLPLAIELVAAQMRHQTLATLPAGLRERVLNLDTDLRDVPARQRSLWHTVDWSYNLLTPDEQRCFRRLAALPAGATQAAASAVSAVAPVAPVLRALVDKHLVTCHEAMGAPRFNLLMPLREYGLARLQAAGEMDLTRRAITDHFVARAESLYDEYFRNAPDIDAQWHALDLDMDNLRAVLQWADAAGDAETYVRLSCSLRRFMRVRDHMAEGLAWAQRAVALIDHAGADLPHGKRLRADAHGALGTHLTEAGDTALGVAHLRQAADDAREAGHTRRLISCLINLGYGLAMLGEFDAARRACEECLTVCEAASDADSVIDVRTCLGTIALRAGDWADARRQLEPVLAHFRAARNTSAAIITASNLAVACQNMGDADKALHLTEGALQDAKSAGMAFLIGDLTGNLAELHLQRGNVALAQQHLIESLRMSWHTQSLEPLANGFLHAAHIAMLRAMPAMAAQLLATARRIYAERGATMTPDNQAEFDASQGAVRDVLTEAAWHVAWAEEARHPLHERVEQACAWLAQPTPQE